MQEIGRYNRPRSPAVCPSSSASTTPASSTRCSSTNPPNTYAVPTCRPSRPPSANHLQLEAILTAGRDSTNHNDFAVVTMLGLLGLRIFEATANISDLSEVHGHRVLRVNAESRSSISTSLISLMVGICRTLVSAALGGELDDLVAGQGDVPLSGALVANASPPGELRASRLSCSPSSPLGHPSADPGSGELVPASSSWPRDP